ncbi:hypothetical protein [Jannaschia faecimaris]|nr:hypothetical protein [Jannaschia faecimaris]
MKNVPEFFLSKRSWHLAEFLPHTASPELPVSAVKWLQTKPAIPEPQKLR